MKLIFHLAVDHFHPAILSVLPCFQEQLLGELIPDRELSEENKQGKLAYIDFLRWMQSQENGQDQSQSPSLSQSVLFKLE